MQNITSIKERFSELLLKWNNEKNNRQMPWKGEKDPFKIWLSEIMLQQTRVEQGLNYYNRFINTFPDIHQLANAPDEKVFKMWEGLGYYSRCKNLLSTARYISKERRGKFPETFEEIKALKGIGPYTAAAIASFAFDMPYAVVDGNVFRVLARVFGIKEPVDTTKGKKIFSHVANELLYKRHPGKYNQAIMDFGAVICKPAAPFCSQCPFQKSCFAFLNKKIEQLPVKAKKISIKHRWFYYLLLEYRGKIAIRQRTHKDIWQQLYEFPLVETTTEQDQRRILQLAIKNKILKKDGFEFTSMSPLYKQKLSHQLISGQFLKVKLKLKPETMKDCIWISHKQIHQFAFPVFINQYLQQKDGRQSLF
jgi:A/G-specific adenine glycosylase